MIEAQISCVCVGGIALVDLGLTLVQGQIIYLDAPRARGSKDLQRAWRSKGITIKYVERYQQRRSAVMTHPVFPSPQSHVAAPLPPDDADQITTLIDPDAIAARVISDLDWSPVIQAFKDEMEKQHRDQDERLVASITTSVVAALQGEDLPSRVSSRIDRPLVDDDVPVFVPSIIGDALEADLEIQATTATEGVVSDAAAALRVAREKQDKPR